LEILDISKNSIDSIPEDIKKMTNLKFLAVARNQIKRLPLALGEMNLVKLKFDENPIEFPPADVLKPPTDRTMADSEKDKEMCQQVKRYMKTAAMREKLRSTSEEDLRYARIPPHPPRWLVHLPMRADLVKAPWRLHVRQGAWSPAVDFLSDPASVESRILKA
jgi:Leucine-rich repeat (LRR) protein